MTFSTTMSKLGTIACVIALAALVPAGMAHATSEASSPTASDENASQTGQARELFNEGVQLFDAGKYEKARLVFARVYELKPHPSVLLNLAQCELRTARYLDAARHLATFLKEASVTDPAVLASANDALAQARAHTGLVRVSVVPEGAEVFVDEEFVGTSPLADPIDVSPGPHRVRARLPGGPFKHVNVTVGRRITVTASIDLRGQSSAMAPPIASTAQEPKETERMNYFPWTTSDPVGLVTAGVTVIGLGLTGVGSIGMGYHHVKGNHNADALKQFLNRAKTGAPPQDTNARKISDTLGRNKERFNLCEELNDSDKMKKINEMGSSGKEGPPVGTHIKYLCDTQRDHYDKRDTYRTIMFVGLGVTVVGAVSNVAGYFLLGDKPADDAISTPSSSPRASIAPILHPQMRGLVISGSF